MNAALLGEGQVVAQQPPRGLLVTLKATGQSTTFPVQVGYVGAADALRASQRPLPSLGTWGLIAFPYGDIRNGIWICSIYPGMQDALTTGEDQGTAFAIDSEAHWSGWLRYLDGFGQEAIQWPDGSFLTAGSGVAMPVLYRNIVDADQKQQKIPFTRADRIPNPPSPFNFTLHHETGAEVQVTASGVVNVSGVGGQTVTVDAAGNVLISAAGGKTVDIVQALAAATDAAVLVSKLVTFFNNHTHSDPQGGDTGTPTTPMASGDVDSAVLKLSG